MLNAFKKHINKNLNFLNKGKLLIAISGGLDSVALTHLCHQAKLNITLAHCNFNLRGKESDADETFILELAEQLNLEVFIQHFETQAYAEEHKLSIQMAARELRYNWFEELAEQLDFDYVLTAHHADDNLETVLINLSRGSGLDGLTGIPKVNGNIIRPLLSFSRDTIEAFAKGNKLKWREDSSNASTKYLRNKLRHDVVPHLKEANPQFLQSFQNTINHLEDTKDIVEESVNAVLKRAIKSIDENKIEYSVSEFIKLNNPKAYLFQVFKDYGFTEWNDVENLLKAQSGKQVFSETHRLLKDRDCLILSKVSSEENTSQIEIALENRLVETTKGLLTIEDVSSTGKNTQNEIFVCKDLLNFPLTLRNWQKGDYFYPLGMQGKKKLSKYFKDEKLSLFDKEKCLLLCSNNEIVWVLNHRADNRFKVNEKTNQILKITLQQ